MEARPIFLLSDSQLLFLKNEKQEQYLKAMVSGIVAKKPACAYIGASNSDEPAFYELFKEAMNSVGFVDCKMITSSFGEDDLEFLKKADLILLAGGDAELGLQILRDKGVEEILRERYIEGALLIGVSAGAIQLGWQLCNIDEGRKYEATEAFKFAPFIVLTHLNSKNFDKVELLLRESNSIKRAYEIPFGGGLIYHPDATVEAIRKPISEFILKDETFIHTLIFPPTE